MVVAGVTYAEARQVLDEKLERKAAEQASAMAQVARQMAAKGAPVPLRLETVFSKQVGHAPHTPRWRDWFGGETRRWRDAPPWPSEGMRGGGVG